MVAGHGATPTTTVPPPPSPALVAAWYRAAAAQQAQAGRYGWHADGYDWMALAVCETHADFTMHGATYSSAFGIVNAGVRQYAPSAEAAQRILSGTASAWEQLVTAVNLERDVGIGGWGCRHAAGG